jgi:hypothetical protein
VTTVPTWLSDVGAELRSRLGDEFRAGAEADERAAAKLRLRRRTLSDVVTEAMHRGDRIAVYLQEGVIQGRPIHVAADLATLEIPPDARLHLNLEASPAFSYDFEARASRGTSRDRTAPDSFLALLRSLEISCSLARLEVSGTAGPPAGRIHAVAADHVIFRGEGGVEWWVPLRKVLGVWEEPGRRPGGTGYQVPGT